MKPPNEEHTVSESTNHVYPKAAAGEQSANVAPNPSFPKLEESVLDYWDKDDTFQKSIERRPSGDHSQNEFVFFDGPPFANGLPHYGHLLTGYAKDVIPRYQTMKGHKVNRVFGWDTHGLPAELEAQKELGIDSVDQVKEMGIDKFNDACRASVLKYTNEWKDYVHRQARWVDFEHGYKTLNHFSEVHGFDPIAMNTISLHRRCTDSTGMKLAKALNVSLEEIRTVLVASDFDPVPKSLKLLIKKRNYTTYKEFAAAAGLKEHHIMKIAKTRTCTTTCAVKLCKALGITEDELAASLLIAEPRHKHGSKLETPSKEAMEEVASTKARRKKDESDTEEECGTSTVSLKRPRRSSK